MFTSKLVAIVFGATFVAVGILGFLPNPVVHAEGIFATNAMHNMVHVLTGLVFLGASTFPDKAAAVTLTIGAAYVLVSILGFLTTSDYMLGLIHINQADRWLHAFLAAAILLVGRIASGFDSRKIAQA